MLATLGHHNLGPDLDGLCLLLLRGVKVVPGVRGSWLGSMSRSRFSGPATNPTHVPLTSVEKYSREPSASGLMVLSPVVSQPVGWEGKGSVPLSNLIRTWARNPDSKPDTNRFSRTPPRGDQQYDSTLLSGWFVPRPYCLEGPTWLPARWADLPVLRLSAHTVIIPISSSSVSAYVHSLTWIHCWTWRDCLPQTDRPGAVEWPPPHFARPTDR